MRNGHFVMVGHYGRQAWFWQDQLNCGINKQLNNGTMIIMWTFLLPANMSHHNKSWLKESVPAYFEFSKAIFVRTFCNYLCTIT